MLIGCPSGLYLTRRSSMVQDKKLTNVSNTVTQSGAAFVGASSAALDPMLGIFCATVAPLAVAYTTAAIQNRLTSRAAIVSSSMFEASDQVDPEKLAEHIIENDNLVDLINTVNLAIYTSHDPGKLKALGKLLGQATNDNAKVDEIGVLIKALAEMGVTHLRLLKALAEPVPTKYDENGNNPERWFSGCIIDYTEVDSVFAEAGLVWLASHCLAKQIDTMGGLAYQITPLGEALLIVLNSVTNEPTSA